MRPGAARGRTCAPVVDPFGGVHPCWMLCGDREALCLPSTSPASGSLPRVESLEPRASTSLENRPLGPVAPRRTFVRARAFPRRAPPASLDAPHTRRFTVPLRCRCSRSHEIPPGRESARRQSTARRRAEQRASHAGPYGTRSAADHHSPGSRARPRIRLHDRPPPCTEPWQARSA